MGEQSTLHPRTAEFGEGGFGHKAVMFGLAAVGALALVLNAAFVDAFGPSRLFAVLAALLILQAVVRCRLVISRETGLYAGFAAYLLVELIWTPDVALSLNTLFPVVNFLLILLVYGSLLIHGDLRVGLLGTVAGLAAGAAIYGYVTRFPLVRPLDFSYNAMAAVYLCGLFCSLAYGWAGQSRVIPFLFALVFWLHVIASTSIKTNLGIVLGAGIAGVFYLRHSLRTLRRSLVIILAVGAMVAYAVGSDQAIVKHLSAGIARVSLGVRVLEAREDLSGYSALGDREFWIERGLEGWEHNPVFGYGVEAFRQRYGITSHSTPVELLYNTGIIGFSLFYAVFASIALRLLAARRSWPRAPLALIMATLICNAFVTLSGTVFYQTFIALFIAISVAIFRWLLHPACAVGAVRTVAPPPIPPADGRSAVRSSRSSILSSG